MRWLFVLLIAATASGQKVQRTWYAREYDDVAIHRWISTDGDTGPGTSWSTGIAPRDQAAGVLTLAANAVAAEAVTLGTKTYTWTDPLGSADGDVLVGGSASASLDNLIAAINLAAGAGSTYAAATTANVDVTAAAGAGDTMDVTAITYEDAVGDAIVSTETMTQGSFVDTTLLSGAVNWAAADEEVFSGASVVDVTTNLNMSNVTVRHWTIQPGYTGNIGASGNQLEIEITSTSTARADLFIHRGSGTVHFSGTAGGFADVVLDSPNLTNALFLDGTIRNLWIKRGRCDLDAGITITSRVELLGSEAILVIGSSIVTPPEVHILLRAGNITWGSTTSTTAGNRMILMGGKWTQTGEIQTQTGIEMYGGELIYKPSADTADTPDLLGLAGILNLGETDRAIQFDDVIIGPDMDIIGDFTTGGGGPGLGVAIDLRDDYPR